MRVSPGLMRLRGYLLGFALHLDRLEEITVEERPVADVLKDPDSATFRWTKTGRDPAQRQQYENADYCAMVNGKNSYGGYTGFKPYK